MMATFEQLILWMDIASLVFIFLCMIFLKKNRDFERLELESSLNVLLFGVFFLFLVTLASTLISAEKLYHVLLVDLLPDAQIYAGYLMNIIELALLPLFSVCFLVAILIARHHLVERAE